jgi:hypothetical protein
MGWTTGDGCPAKVWIFTAKRKLRNEELHTSSPTLHRIWVGNVAHMGETGNTALWLEDLTGTDHSGNLTVDEMGVNWWAFVNRIINLHVLNRG